ncbi:MAG: gliding motility protein GldN [Candidatus Symbiothrix sp.]|nr:gliding motility protein GldN [Candidatus Symbiothrix sp.]
MSLVFLLFAGIQEVFSQDPPQRRTRQRPSETTTTDNAPALTERAKIKNEEESKAPAHIAWLREIYRNIDLQKETNTPLYYPTQPVGNRLNLFTLIFKLIADGKISAYNYVEGREVFTDEEKINFEGILEKYNILYTKQGTENDVKYVVEENDIPSAEVLIYMIKEGWYFDAATGTFKSQVIAICPLLVREDFYYGGVSKNALFWIPYETIRPYLSRELIMTSNYNNTLTYTMDDYFTKKMYSGEIIKTTNLMNLALVQQVGNDSIALKQAQDSIESQLQAFNKNLWIHSDTIPLPEGDNKKAKATKKKPEKATKTKASKPEKSSSSTRSVRRR